MFRNALRLVSIRGIEIRVDVSWLLIAALVTWSFWGQFRLVYDRDVLPSLGLALIAALLFFSSVLAHELAHAFEARHRGVRVGGITLFVFGGVTENRSEAERPVDEFSLTVVGPLTSLVLAAGFAVVASIAQDDATAVAEVAGLLGWINLALGLFNLIPGAPLDGGRILRAAVWKATGDRDHATRVAARAGRVVGFGFIALGVLEVLFVRGGLFAGLWLALIGLFLRRAADAELARAQVAASLDGLAARDVGIRSEPAVGSDPVDAVLARWATSEGPDRVPVTDRQGDLVGVLELDQAAAVDARDRPVVPVSRVMRKLDELPTVGAGEPAAAVLERFDDAGLVVITEGGRPVGVTDPPRVLGVAQRRARAAAARATTGAHQDGPGAAGGSSELRPPPPPPPR